jgi:hypothetical protein
MAEWVKFLRLKHSEWRLPARIKSGESADKPGSVVNSHSSGSHVTVRLMQPTRKHARARAAVLPLRLPYLALLQVGFAVPRNVATRAVRSYRTVSPLPASLLTLRRFIFCCTFRELALPRRYLAPCPPSPDFPPPPTPCGRGDSDCLADSPWATIHDLTHCLSAKQTIQSINVRPTPLATRPESATRRIHSHQS